MQLYTWFQIFITLLLEILEFLHACSRPAKPGKATMNYQSPKL